MNETERTQLIQDAFAAGRDAILEHLGHDRELVEVIEVVKHLAYEFLTEGQTLDIETALDEAAFFKARLVKLIPETLETCNE
jgi:hypothetical protein